ncbi:MAG TPA: response regulator [Bdellovibrionota bacterium]|nr:response regulator [Bdellovibrionota bacterium]
MKVPVVLVIDDNPITRKMVRVALKQEGYETVEAGDGRTAILSIQDRLPDLILQDFRLPDVDGCDLARQIRALPGAKEIPILGFTGFLTQAEELRVGTSTFDDILVKPVEPSRLIKTVKAYVPIGGREGAVKGAGRRILIVDDDPVQLKLLATRLRILGFETAASTDGQEALRVAHEFKPDGIVSDVLMPRFDGFQFCLAVRRDPELQKIPVVLVSSHYLDEIDREFGVKVGADAFVNRSPSMDDVISAIDVSLKRKSSPSPRLDTTQLEGEHMERAMLQLERQAAINAGLTERCLIQSAALSVLGATSGALAGQEAIEEALDLSLQHCLDASGLSRGALYLMDSENRLVLQAEVGFSSGSQAKEFFGHRELFVRVVTKGRSVVFPSADITETVSKEFLTRTGNATAALLVPILFAEDVLGVLLMVSQKRDLSSADWLSFAQIVAAQLGQALVINRSYRLIKDSEERYRNLMENANDAVFVLGSKGAILEANLRAQQLLGLSKDRIVGRVAWEFMEGDGGERLVREYPRLLDRKPRQVDGIRLKRSDGRVVITDLALSAVDIAQEKVVLAIARDVTEKERIARELETRVRQQEEIARLSASALASTGLDEFFHESVEGVKRGLEVEWAHILELPPDGPKFVLRSGESWSGESIRRAKAESRARFNLLSESSVVIEDFSKEERFADHLFLSKKGLRAGLSVVIHGKDRPFGVLEAFTRTDRVFGRNDIHFLESAANILADAVERRTSTAKLHESEERQKQILDAIADLVFVKGADSRLLWGNKAFRDYYGVTIDDVQDGARWASRGRGMQTLPDDTFVFETGKSLDIPEEAVPRQDGEMHLFHTVISPIVDQQGRVVMAVGVARDITERKKLHSQLLISDRMVSVGTLAAGVAHEINNPLAAVLANTEFLKKKIGDIRESDLLVRLHADLAPVQSDIVSLLDPLEETLEAAERIRTTVKDLKIFSRPDEESRGPLDVRRVLDSVARMAWNEVRHRARLVKDYGPAPFVDGNDARIGQVFLNLIINAAQAIPEGQADQNEIRISTVTDDEGNTVVRVRDTGSGIPPEIAKQIFDPFFTTKPVGVGTGLGLSICHRIVTSYGGTISFESQPTRGTTFQVVFPPARLEATLPPIASDAASISRRGRILVIDDEKIVCSAVERTLAVDHIVETVQTAQEALDQISAGERFDVILCDLMMPKMTGMELYEEVLRFSKDQADRMIFLTGGAFTPRARDFLVRVNNQRVEKPFDPKNLRSIVSDRL